MLSLTHCINEEAEHRLSTMPRVHNSQELDLLNLNPGSQHQRPSSHPLLVDSSGKWRSSTIYSPRLLPGRFKELVMQYIRVRMNCLQLGLPHAPLFHMECGSRHPSQVPMIPWALGPSTMSWPEVDHATQMASI